MASTADIFSSTESSTEAAAPSYQQDSEVCVYYKFIISVVIMGSFCLVGMVGNLICLAALRILYLTSSSTGSSVILLIALSCCDFLVLAAFLVLKVSVSFCAFHGLCVSYFQPYFWIALYGWPLLSLFHCLSTWMTVLLTVHRYIAVCHPLKAKSWTRTSKLKLQIPLVTISAIVYNVPGFLDYEAVPGDYGYQRELTALGANHWYQILYKQVGFLLFVYLGPALILLILGAFLVKSITKAESFRSAQNQSKGQGQDEGEVKKGSSAADDMTRIMIAIVALYLITQPWEVMRRLMAETFKMEDKCGDFLYYFGEIPSLLAVINSTMNFVVYCFVGTRFRKACKQLCTRTKVLKSETSVASDNNTEQTQTDASI